MWHRAASCAHTRLPERHRRRRTRWQCMPRHAIVRSRPPRLRRTCVGTATPPPRSSVNCAPWRAKGPAPRRNPERAPGQGTRVRGRAQGRGSQGWGSREWGSRGWGSQVARGGFRPVPVGGKPKHTGGSTMTSGSRSTLTSIASTRGKRRDSKINTSPRNLHAN